VSKKKIKQILNVKRRSILIVDDDQTFLALFKAIVGAKWNLDVITADSASEGLACLEISTPDLIYCDLYLPDKEDGYSVYDYYRNNLEGKAYSIFVFLSGASGNEEREDAYKQGALEFVDKTDFKHASLFKAHMNALLSLVAKGRQNQRREQELRQTNEQLSRALSVMEKRDMDCNACIKEVLILGKRLEDWKDRDA